ncbi:3,4-dihydroxy-2-butanone 4-phosphate synthase [Thamnocephalis sphaerospora]|uniref:3,4-dihydroxy-2-butanone 4-phosphate synthase n=1 Tax=Thamnocephalis sphaerospora TaxID=78915 RepID=A0A4P9XHZ4_9FUNG|nr:3,4-dihydroxy-2-butanone 4-phosphate synthase [Thamnocephalis sphaerospora]|eukprot:RKP05335.1 3,4-dihydroxy-2-butanone 4-phosphate synthase [Thamnocephalis sphaerospora]
MLHSSDTGSAPDSQVKFDSIPDALADFAQDKFLVVVDNEDRENEGDLIIAAENVTAADIAFMVRYTSGVICCPLKQDRLEELSLPLMVPKNSESFHTAFTVTVDYKQGTTTGISASDRAITLRALADPEKRDPDAFAKPGHIFPLRYTEGGVLTRPGHTEASIDLCELAGKRPAGVLCEIVNDDGTMARRDDCFAFARRWGLKMISIADLAAYRQSLESSKQ